MNDRATDFSYGVVSPEILKSYDGLSFLRAMIAGTVPQPTSPIAKPLAVCILQPVPEKLRQR